MYAKNIYTQETCKHHETKNVMYRLTLASLLAIVRFLDHWEGKDWKWVWFWEWHNWHGNVYWVWPWHGYWHANGMRPWHGYWHGKWLWLWHEYWNGDGPWV